MWKYNECYSYFKNLGYKELGNNEYQITFKWFLELKIVWMKKYIDLKYGILFIKIIVTSH